MRHPSPEELNMAYRIRKITGKKLRTCIFCVQINRGNFDRALDYCIDDSPEDGR